MASARDFLLRSYAGRGLRVWKRESAAVFEIARFLICETRHRICVGRHGCDSLATGSVRTVTLNGTAAATNYRQPLIVMIGRHKA